MRVFKLLTVAMLLVVSGLPSKAQISLSDSSVTIPMAYMGYSHHFTAADMAERFGASSFLSPGFQVKTASQWFFGAEAGFILGGNFRPGFSIFNDWINSNGNIINGDGVPAVVALFERGLIFTGKFGRLFPLSKRNPNSGLLVSVSAGYLQHKLKIEVENKSAPQLKGDYARGYDRLTSGFTIGQSVGYLFIGKRRLLNFYFGVEIYEAFTKSRREYVFDLMGPEEGQRLDILIGPKVTWIIPFYKRAPEEYYFY